MKPSVNLGPTIPSVKPFVEVTGQIRYTAIKINPQKFTNGKLSLYDQNGQYCLGFHGRTFKMFQLSQNIQSLSTRVGHITIVLSNGFQIIAKGCAEESIKLLETCLNDIKHFGSVKGRPSRSERKFAISSDDQHKSLESSRKLAMKVRKLSPLPSQKKNTRIVSPLSDTSAKRNQIDRVKASILEFPLSDKENRNAGKDAKDSQPFHPISIEDEEVSTLTVPTPIGSWSRPPGEKRTHSPGLRYGCSASSSPLGFSGYRSKSPKAKKRLLDHATFCSKNNDSLDLDDFDEEKSWLSFPSKSPILKRTYGSRKSASPSPLRPKILQEDNQNSTEHVSSEKHSGHKLVSFYGTSRSSLLPSLAGDKKKFQHFNWRGKGLKRLLPDISKQNDYKTSPFGSKPVIDGLAKQSVFKGFANLGNTCYMNAILQCLLGTPVFAHDLGNPFLLKNVTQDSLYKCLHTLEMAKRSNNSPSRQQIALRSVKKAISNQAERFSGDSQHDAHEFLGQCLDQLKDDIIKTIPSSDGTGDSLAKASAAEKRAREAACPVARNFECHITHKIKCVKCENQITKEEVFYDLSLDIPEIDENTNPDPDDKDIQELLQEYFKEEEIGYKCEECAHEYACLSHHISSLPRVVILHLKRYELNHDCSKYKKKLDTVDVPLEIDLGALCNKKTRNPLHFDATPKGGYKRQLSSETPDDTNDFQPGLKARRKLSLPSTPVLSNSDDAEAGLAFKKVMEKATKLSLDAATEEEQLEWALNESMKTDQLSVIDINAMENDDGLQQDIHKIDPLNGNGEKVDDGIELTDIFSKKKAPETFTGLRERSRTAETCEGECEGSDVVKITEQSESLTTNIRATENIDDSISMEEVSELKSEDYQLKLAMELSLKEFNKQSNEKENLKQKMKSNRTMTNALAKKKQKVATDVNGISRKYRLIGVVSHIGDSSFAGHYISDVFDCKECEWKSYNDSTVCKATEYQVRYGRKQSSYIFFYIDKECFNLITKK